MNTVFPVFIVIKNSEIVRNNPGRLKKKKTRKIQVDCDKKNAPKVDSLRGGCRRPSRRPA